MTPHHRGQRTIPNPLARLGQLARSSAQTAGVPESSRPAINGLRISDMTRFMNALAAQGVVSLLANPRILVLNNEPAVVRAGSDRGGARGQDRSSEPDVTLAVTPQIAEDGVIMLSMSPIVSLHTVDPEGKLPGASAYREADTLARVADGETIVIAGFTRDREIRSDASGCPADGSGRSTVVTRKRIEL